MVESDDTETHLTMMPLGGPSLVQKTGCGGHGTAEIPFVLRAHQTSRCQPVGATETVLIARDTSTFKHAGLPPAGPSKS
jgi:hypothetical protein